MEQTLADLVKVGFLTGALCVAARSCPVERPSVIRPAGAQWVPIKITGPKAAQILGEPLDYASVESYAANAKPDTTALLVDLPSLKTQTSLPLVYKQPIVNYATKDLSKDTECVLLARMLFGEARNCSDAEKRAIASTALHRVNQGGRYGNNLHAVLLKPKQYSCFNEKDPNFAKLKDPLKYDAKSFERCLLIAGEVLAKHYVLEDVKV